MVKQRIQAILSDYDGTLVPTENIKDPKANSIPIELEEVLKKVSSDIPVCVISTKDFKFLGERTVFARIVSCMMGIETVVLSNHWSSRNIEKRLLQADIVTLQTNSEALAAIAGEVALQKEFSHMIIERKYTSDGILAGLTIDWRNLSDWSSSSSGISHFISKLVANLRKPPAPVSIYVQKYSMHPFIDIYGTRCDKGVAFDTVISELMDASIDNGSVLYLGDSENDNPAFRKAGVSIGIRSDTRLNPKLDCSYFLNYEELSPFLMRLRENEYVFSEGLLLGEKA